MCEPEEVHSAMSFRKYRYYTVSIWRLLTGLKPTPAILRAFLRRSDPKDQIIQLRRSGLRFKTRGVMDIWSIKETFLDRFYQRFSTSIGDGWTVFDIGGGIGDFAIFVASQNPKNVVYAFEPTPRSFTLLQENLQLNQIENARVYPQAIWSSDGQIVIDTTAGEPGQYVSRTINVDEKTKNDRILVPSITLSRAFEATGLGNCNLMKIDCEGAEYEILFGTPPAVLDRIERIIMEYHDNVTKYTHTDLVAFLRDQGFAVKTYPNDVHDYLGYLYASR
jgi:FkbM family methyltransferase